MSIWRWADWLPPVPESCRLTLGEGNTPLLKSRSIGPRAGIAALYFKLETTNPSGSYKDRFAALAVSLMAAQGKRVCLATSSGNTGAALAAYCAAAGVRCEIAVVEGAPADKLLQAQAHGAVVRRVRGFGQGPEIDGRVLAALRRRGARGNTAFQISAFRECRDGMSGLKTTAYELGEQLPGATHVFAPAGSGGLALGLALGFADLVRKSRLAQGPRIECVQPEGNATVAGPLERGEARAVPVACTTLISGLQVPSIIDGQVALEACRTSGGTGHLVSDADIWEAQRRLALEEGIFCEPAGAAALAGAMRHRAMEKLPADAVVVCMVTGSGFKDLASVKRGLPGTEPSTIDVEELEREGTP
ncbi:MAG: pyridoxal-phosphate dependent enzyme [Planctomycetia bacterium]|nr:pyridoxal-phosphate dependent enzyme [Planctomycetia bacterium]